MTDVVKDLLKEQREQKKIANQARHKRGHCGKGGYYMETDGMTKKEIEAKNGPVYVYQTDRPMTWNEFKALPKHLQEMYIHHLQTRYNISISKIGKDMWHNECVGRTIRALGITYKARTTSDKRADAKQRAAWAEFLGKDKSVAQSTTKSIPSACDEVKTVAVVPDPPKTRMTSMSMNYTGRIDPNEISNSLRTLFGDNSFGDIHIEVTLKE